MPFSRPSGARFKSSKHHHDRSSSTSTSSTSSNRIVKSSLMGNYRIHRVFTN